jgi:hypothetical protein
MISAPERPSTRLEIFIGRSLAVCVHPFAAWATGSTAARLTFFVGYFLASYMFIMLMVFAADILPD